MNNRIFYALMMIAMLVGLGSCRHEELPDDLPKVELSVPVAYDELEKTDVPCLFYLTDPKRTSVNDGQARIKLRGNSTATCPKRPFRIKLSEKRSLCGMPKAKKWVLLANYFDPSMLRNALAFRISEDSRLSWTPRSCFVELVYNHSHKGTYQLCEKIEAGSNRVELAEDGWLIEIDGRASKEDSWFMTEHMENAYRIAYPDTENGGEKEQQLKAFFREVEATLFGEEFTDPVEGWRKYLNEVSWIDWYLVNEIAKNNDAVFYSSCYMHSGRDGRVVMGPVWDFDLAFGNCEWNGCDHPDGWHVRTSNWYARLFEDPSFEAAVRERFRFFYGKRESYYRFIRSQKEILRPHVQQTTDNYDEETEALIRWLEQRFEWMNAQL